MFTMIITRVFHYREVWGASPWGFGSTRVFIPQEKTYTLTTVKGEWQ